ncbi:MAG: TIGR03943 family protein [Dermatophilaceae bacterium]|nr:TIGR03943 family protein [Intrasporangiaceae bacterium]
MNRLTQGVIMAVIGATVITATITGLFLNFVKDILEIPLLVAAVILILMGLYQAFAEDRGPDAVVHRPGHDVAHDKVSLVGWFLVLPFLVMSVVVPPPLGAYSAQRDTGLTTQVAGGGWEPLPPGDPVEMTLGAYQGRALFDESESLRDRQIRLIGFVSSVDSGEGWAITRLALNCCAADGYALKVDVVGGEPLPDDTWIEAVGRWVPTPPNADGSYSLPILEIESMGQIEPPENPYE